jgi:hypothetical protein
MEQLQIIDLILGIVLKAVFIIGMLVLVLIVIRIQSSIKQVELGVSLLNNRIQNVANRIQSELTFESITEKIQSSVGGVFRTWLLGGIGKEISLFLKRRSRK